METVARLIDALKQQSGKFNYGSTGNGTSQHLSAELFKSIAGRLARANDKGAEAL